ncbi:Uma2 family endonuclease [Streptomyces sp. C36]|uniref:Uma2 family endonuclease n=1 Tax=Streptomyces sp. C36 TaxID=3237122 RepID=UPI0034C5C70B
MNARDRATPETWMHPPPDGWTYDQVKGLGLQFNWEFVDGGIVVREMTDWWHDAVRDKLYLALMSAMVEPFTANIERCVMVDERTVVKSDIVLFDKRGLDVHTLDCVPADRVVLAIEVSSTGTRPVERFLKPGLYAEAGTGSYWRVERGDGDVPVVHELSLHAETARNGAPTRERAAHVGTLKTDVPFPVEIDLRDLIEL